MKLYKIEASNWSTFFGPPEEPIVRDVIRLAQTPSNDAFLLLAKDTQDEIKILKKLLKELYVLAEPTRIKGYTDEEMFEANAANEFTVNMGREIQSEMIANGRPSAARIRNAMSNPHTWNALKQIGLIPKQTKILEGNINPQLKIELKGVEDEVI